MSAVAYFTEQMSACDERLNAETKGIAELDTRVAEATMIRQDVHAESGSVTDSNASTSKLFRLAINRLTKFHARALHEATPKAKLSVQDRIHVNMGGEISTAAPTGIAGTDVAHVQVLQEPAAEPFPSKFEKKTEGLSGLVAILKELMADVEELTKARIVEKNSQEQNEDFRTESSKSRADTVTETMGRIHGDRSSFRDSRFAPAMRLVVDALSKAKASVVGADFHALRCEPFSRT